MIENGGLGMTVRKSGLREVGLRAGILMLLSTASVMAGAAIPSQQNLYTQTLTAKKNRYLSDGVFTGGKAGSGASVLNMRRVYSRQAQIERVIVDMGDKDGKAQPGQMSYFQASIEGTSRRVVLDMAQLKMSKVTEIKLKDMFAKSPYVAGVEFSLDPEDRDGTMVLQLKQPMRLEVFQLLEGKRPARVVLDLTPLKTAAAPAAPTKSNKVKR